MIFVWALAMFLGATLAIAAPYRPIVFAEVCEPVGFQLSKRGNDVLIRCNDNLPSATNPKPLPYLTIVDCPKPVIKREPARVTIVSCK